MSIFEKFVNRVESFCYKRLNEEFQRTQMFRLEYLGPPSSDMDRLVGLLHSARYAYRSERLATAHSQLKQKRRSLKWWYIQQLKQRPWTRGVYPIFQILAGQRVWIVEHAHWFIAKTPERAAGYWGTYSGDDCWAAHETSGQVVQVRRPFGATISLVVEYAGHDEYTARPVGSSSIWEGWNKEPANNVA